MYSVSKTGSQLINVLQPIFFLTSLSIESLPNALNAPHISSSNIKQSLNCCSLAE